MLNCQQYDPVREATKAKINKYTIKIYPLYSIQMKRALLNIRMNSLIGATNLIMKMFS
jgi:hypothetical protein